MKRKIIVYRFQTFPSPNLRMAEALVEFYRADVDNATMHPSVFGIVSNFITTATPEEIFQKLVAANVGNDFTIIELDQNDRPVKTITSTGVEIVVGETSVSGPIDNDFIDLRMTEEELEAEFNRLLDKVHGSGLNSLTAAEKSRMEHLSQR